uniref:Uncharacterized protein n=1 Tax=Oryza meridionalis TaxID=40149 RepID=A0A0E0CEI1_9ORYZ
MKGIHNDFWIASRQSVSTSRGSRVHRIAKTINAFSKALGWSAYLQGIGLFWAINACQFLQLQRMSLLIKSVSWLMRPFLAILTSQQVCICHQSDLHVVAAFYASLLDSHTQILSPPLDFLY